MSEYSKGSFADQLGISRNELESRAREAGFDNTEAYYNSGNWGGSSSNTINPNNIPSVMDFAMNQETGISNALGQLTMAYRGLESPIDVWNQLEEAMGLPAQKQVAQTLRDQIAGLEDSIRRVKPNIAKTTTQSMVTEGQRAMMEQAQKQPMLEHLSQFATALGRVDEGIRAMSSDLANKVNLFMQGQQMALEPLKIQFSAMVDRAARLTSAFGVDAQNQLNVMLTNVKRGWELEDREREEAFQLIMAEQGYNQELTKLGLGLGLDISGSDNPLKTLSEGFAEQIAYEREQAQKKSGESGFDIEGFYKSLNPNGSGNIDYTARPQVSAVNGSTHQDANGFYWTWNAEKNKWE